MTGIRVGSENVGGDPLAERFEAQRGHLHAVAYRMLGSHAEAEDAVQETWLRLDRGGAGVDNLGGWLTTVTSRICLDVLRARRNRPEQPTDALPEPRLRAVESEPEAHAETADAVGAALLVVLDTLGPAERLAFVLHDLFAVPFDTIGAVLGRSPEAARQLASRARRRVQGGSAGPDDRARRRAVVEAFLAASREGRFEALVALLDPDAVLRADAAAVATGAQPEVVGAAAVAATFAGRARAAELALVDGVPGLVWRRHGQPQVVFCFDVVDDRVRGITLIGDPDRLARARVSRRDGEVVLEWSDDDGPV